MKKILLVFCFVGLLILSVILLRENIELKSKNNVDVDNIGSVEHKNMLSMMLETKAGSGNYELTTRESWPTEGYIFNSTLSKCENGGELSWDDENRIIFFTAITFDCFFKTYYILDFVYKYIFKIIVCNK